MGSKNIKQLVGISKSSAPLTEAQRIDRARQNAATNKANFKHFHDQGYDIRDSMLMGMKKGFTDRKDAYRARRGFSQPGMAGTPLAKVVKANKAKAKRHLK